MKKKRSLVRLTLIKPLNKERESERRAYSLHNSLIVIKGNHLYPGGCYNIRSSASFREREREKKESSLREKSIRKAAAESDFHLFWGHGE